MTTENRKKKKKKKKAKKKKDKRGRRKNKEIKSKTKNVYCLARHRSLHILMPMLDQLRLILTFLSRIKFKILTNRCHAIYLKLKFLLKR